MNFYPNMPIGQNVPGNPMPFGMNEEFNDINNLFNKINEFDSRIKRLESRITRIEGNIKKDDYLEPDNSFYML